jgi:hypothetical protein
MPAAPFKAKAIRFSTCCPISVLFPGNGIQDNLADHARKSR